MNPYLPHKSRPNKEVCSSLTTKNLWATLIPLKVTHNSVSPRNLIKLLLYPLAFVLVSLITTLGILAKSDLEIVERNEPVSISKQTGLLLILHWNLHGQEPTGNSLPTLKKYLGKFGDFGR